MTNIVQSCSETPREIELKLALRAADIPAFLAAVGAVPDAREAQHTTYFDTPDGAFHAAGLALRVRRTPDGAVQTLKTGAARSAGLFDRAERECPCPGERPALDLWAGLPERLTDPLVTATLDARFTSDIVRTRWRLADGEAEIELVLDEGRILAGTASSAVCEAEFELRRGAPEALFALARRLGAAVPLRLGFEAKSERGHALLAGTPGAAVKAGPVVLDKGIDAASAFAAIAGSCLRHYRANEDRLRARHDAETLHQAHVALRRLRVAMQVFDPAATAAQRPLWAATRAALRDASHVFGRARDLDVFTAERAHDPITQARFGPLREAAYAEIDALIDGPWLAATLLDVLALAQTGAVDPAIAVEPFAADVLARLRRRLIKRGRDLSGLEPEARHRVRLLGKRLRYAGEFFAALWPGDKARRRYKTMAGALARLQEALGALNDLAAAEALLGTHEPPDPDFFEAMLADAEAAYDDFAAARRYWR